MTTVTILNGRGRGGMLIKNQTFTLLKGMQITAKGDKHITVDGTKLYGCPSARIKVRSTNDFVINGALPEIIKSPVGRRNSASEKTLQAVSLIEDDSVVEVESTESDAEIVNRINKRFGILDKLTMGARRGDIRSLFVTGAPGVGKTFGVEKTLAEAGMIEQFAGEGRKYEIVSGAMTAIGLYMTLYKHKDANSVLVLDDCDMVFTDEAALNLLKAALDTSKIRKIYWNVDSKSLRKMDIPNDFEFEGSVIFISNINFRKVRDGKMRSHLSALMSRSHFLDLTVHTFREKLLRIEDLVANKGMLAQFNLKARTEKAIMEFLRSNAEAFNELSLRSIIKLAGLAKTCDEVTEDWEEIARESLMGNPLAY